MLVHICMSTIVVFNELFSDYVDKKEHGTSKEPNKAKLYDFLRNKSRVKLICVSVLD